MYKAETVWLSTFIEFAETKKRLISLPAAALAGIGDMSEEDVVVEQRDGDNAEPSSTGKEADHVLELAQEI